MVTLNETLILSSLGINFLLFIFIAVIAVRQWLFEKVLKEITRKVLGGQEQKPNFVMGPNGPIPITPEMEEQMKKDGENLGKKPGYFG